jgi:hypothetical protein
MTSAELLADAFGRVRGVVHRAVDGLTAEQLAARVDPQANSIAWLVWHLTRIQDDHLAGAFQAEQVWVAQGWAERFGLPFDPRDTGYGHQADDVAAVRVASGELLVGYHDAVHERSTSRRPGTSRGSVTPSWPASSTAPGIRRCPWACGW